MKSNFASVFLVLVTFFVISFITNILGPLFPFLVSDFDISLAVAGFLPFSFFAAYGVASIPSGLWVEKYGEKKVMLAAFTLSTMGSLMFALMPNFSMAMLSLFLIGIGMAMLQVAINPLLRVAGGEQHFAFYSVLAQLLFGGAAALSPLLYSYITLEMAQQPTAGFVYQLQQMIPENMHWLSMYWIFAALSALMLVYIGALKLPKVNKNADEDAGTWAVYLTLFNNRTVLLFFVGIACYVATEQGVANMISLFLERYHNLDPATVGANTVSQFWFMLTMGCILGLLLVKVFDSRLVLKLFSAAAVISLTAALFGDKATSLLAFPMVGFFLSVMWSVIFSLALNSVSENHGAFAGILCTGIVGGGLASPIIGFIADCFDDLRIGMVVVYLALFYIFAIGFWAKPLINNQTLNLFGKKSDSEA